MIKLEKPPRIIRPPPPPPPQNPTQLAEFNRFYSNYVSKFSAELTECHLITLESLSYLNATTTSDNTGKTTTASTTRPPSLLTVHYGKKLKLNTSTRVVFESANSTKTQLGKLNGSVVTKKLVLAATSATTNLSGLMLVDVTRDEFSINEQNNKTADNNNKAVFSMLGNLSQVIVPCLIFSFLLLIATIFMFILVKNFRSSMNSATPNSRKPSFLHKYMNRKDARNTMLKNKNRPPSPCYISGVGSLFNLDMTTATTTNTTPTSTQLETSTTNSTGAGSSSSTMKNTPQPITSTVLSTITSDLTNNNLLSPFYTANNVYEATTGTTTFSKFRSKNTGVVKNNGDLVQKISPNTLSQYYTVESSGVDINEIYASTKSSYELAVVIAPTSSSSDERHSRNEYSIGGSSSGQHNTVLNTTRLSMTTFGKGVNSMTKSNKNISKLDESNSTNSKKSPAISLNESSSSYGPRLKSSILSEKETSGHRIELSEFTDEDDDDSRSCYQENVNSLTGNNSDGSNGIIKEHF